VNYSTSDSTAIAGADYNAASGKVTFPPGTVTRSVSVAVLGDLLEEDTEQFIVNLSGAVNGSIADSTGIGSIEDNDPSPSISIADVTTVEGNSGLVPCSITVTLSAPSGKTVTVNYRTQDITAVEESDYVPVASGGLSFAPGETSKTITIYLLGDNTDEIDETFLVSLSNPINVTISDGTGIATIDDDDGFGLSISDITVVEGNSDDVNAVFTVSMAQPSAQTVSVHYATQDGSATIAGNDYIAASGSVTFSVGSTTQAITITVQGDISDEIDETFSVVLSSPVDAFIQSGTGTGTIDDDDGPEISISDASIAEGNSGTVSIIFTFTLSAPSPQTVTVNFATSDGTATAGSGDYDAASGTLTFDPYETQKTITITVHGDTLFEADENFLVVLSAAVDASILDGQGIAMIYNEDRFLLYMAIVLR
jgi:hypothetical protein